MEETISLRSKSVDVTEYKLSGELLFGPVMPVFEAVRSMADAQTDIVFDMADVALIDSVHLAAFHYLATQLARSGHTLTITHACPRVEKAFRVTGVEQFVYMRHEDSIYH